MIARSKNNARRQLNQCLKAPAVHRQIFRELPIYNGADRPRLGVDQWRTPLYSYGLR